jgi:hypothetical protein
MKILSSLGRAIDLNRPLFLPSPTQIASGPEGESVESRMPPAWPPGLQRLHVLKKKCADANLDLGGHSPTRCFSSQTRRAASKSAFVRVRLPWAARRGWPLTWPAFLGRPRPLRALDLGARRAADSLMGRWPVFIISIISSFQAKGVGRLIMSGGASRRGGPFPSATEGRGRSENRLCL